METVSLSRSFEGEIEPVREAMLDLGPFMEAAGFDRVAVDGREMTITNHVGLLTIELDLRCVETDSVLAYEQVDGIFETMTTRYTLESGDGTVTVTATTDFALDVNLVGPILDGTIISRQRRKELTAQFDYLEDVAAEAIAAK
ncbi:SRPBCC family protein [Salinibaculum salinum]|uniref:SRPBCC family protein n=1 Tax=Salinibaculum salinum TaxID=3131996 RepID=UPI0030EBCDD9